MKPAAPVITALGIGGPQAFGLERGTLESAKQREPHNLDVEAHRPVLDVVEVVLDSLLERCVAAPAIHLRPACDACLDLVAEHVLRNAVFELLDEIRTLGPRTDDRHVAAQHVPELRQLVDVEAAQPPADRPGAGGGGSTPTRTGAVL